MKTCPYCGCLHGNRATQCRGCGTSFMEGQPARELHFRFLLAPHVLCIFWLVIIAAFTGYGFFGPGSDAQMYGTPFNLNRALEPTLILGGWGFCIATSLIVGLDVVEGIRTRGLARWMGLLILFGSLFVSAMIPQVLTTSSGLFHGEKGVWELMESVGEAMFAVLSFIIFSLCALIVPRR